jgi:hypothetical protein
MGFLDKAKKMAEQAQAKLDEVQSQFNQGQDAQQQSGAPPVEYDKHGRPVQPAPVAPDAAAPGAPPAAAPEPPAAPAPPQGAQPDPAEPSSPGPAPSAPPAPPGPAPTEDRNRPSTEPPKLSSGDPLAG